MIDRASKPESKALFSFKQLTNELAPPFNTRSRFGRMPTQIHKPCFPFMNELVPSFNTRSRFSRGLDVNF